MLLQPEAMKYVYFLAKKKTLNCSKTLMMNEFGRYFLLMIELILAKQPAIVKMSYYLCARDFFLAQKFGYSLILNILISFFKIFSEIHKSVVNINILNRTL